MKNFLIAFLVFLAIDMIWLGFIGKSLYQKYLGYLMTDKINWIAALTFYILFIIGLLIFVINPALLQKSLNKAIFYGALYGLITYATYDLTNLATIKNWPLTITIIDLFWGTFLSTAVSLITFLISKKI
ncbi:MAG: DUF2177 family protein [Microgenomates group bacterium]|nr:DUF2177 family protein [Microgenomates group bacterium]